MKPSIETRETSNGGITLAGVTETKVTTVDEMAACLEQGSPCRAIGSTNMNSSSNLVNLYEQLQYCPRTIEWDLHSQCMMG